jgi:hypothetical protein
MECCSICDEDYSLGKIADRAYRQWEEKKKKCFSIHSLVRGKKYLLFFSLIIIISPITKQSWRNGLSMERIAEAYRSSARENHGKRIRRICGRRTYEIRFYLAAVERTNTSSIFMVGLSGDSGKLVFCFRFHIGKQT